MGWKSEVTRGINLLAENLVTLSLFFTLVLSVQSVPHGSQAFLTVEMNG